MSGGAWSVGDTWPSMVVQLMDDNTPISAAGALGVAAHLGRPDGTKFNVPAIVQPDGTVRVDWNPAHFTVAGEYRIKIVVTWDVGKIQSFPSDHITTFDVADAA